MRQIARMQSNFRQRSNFRNYESQTNTLNQARDQRSESRSKNIRNKLQMHAEKLKSLEFLHNGGNETSGKQKRQIFANDNDQWSNSALSMKRQEFIRSSILTPISQGDGGGSITGLRRNKLPPLDEEG
jgi:hypothetical protein